MKELNEVAAFTKEIEIVHLQAGRIIGKETRSGGKLGNMAPKLWDEVFASNSHEILKGLPLLFNELLGWTCEYDAKTDTFVYLVCVLTPAGTKVPEGFVYRDVPETLCAIGEFGESVEQTIKKVQKLGYKENWAKPGSGWNAELSFHEEEENPPKENCTPWHWLVPVTCEK